MSNTAFRCGISTSLRLVSAPQVKKMMESTALAALGDRLRRLTDSAHPAVALTRADPAGGERGDVVRVRCQQQLGGLLYARQQVRIAHQIRDPQLRESGLTRAEQLPGSAQLEVAARDLKAARALPDHPEALARQCRQRPAVQQHAGARLRAAPDAPAQLMQLPQSHAIGLVEYHEA